MPLLPPTPAVLGRGAPPLGTRPRNWDCSIARCPRPWEKVAAPTRPETTIAVLVLRIVLRRRLVVASARVVRARRARRLQKLRGSAAFGLVLTGVFLFRTLRLGRLRLRSVARLLRGRPTTGAPCTLTEARRPTFVLRRVGVRIFWRRRICVLAAAFSVLLLFARHLSVHATWMDTAVHGAPEADRHQRQTTLAARQAPSCPKCSVEPEESRAKRALLLF